MLFAGLIGCSGSDLYFCVNENGQSYGSYIPCPNNKEPITDPIEEIDAGQPDVQIDQVNVPDSQTPDVEIMDSGADVQDSSIDVVIDQVVDASPEADVKSILTGQWRCQSSNNITIDLQIDVNQYLIMNVLIVNPNNSSQWWHYQAKGYKSISLITNVSIWNAQKTYTLDEKYVSSSNVYFDLDIPLGQWTSGFIGSCIKTN